MRARAATASDGSGVAAAPTATASTAGVLRPHEFARHVDLAREPVGESAGRWVENRWSLRWDLPQGRWFDSEVIPHPTCSLTLELGSHPRAAMPPGETVAVTGVCTRRFDVDLRGWGRVVGLRFRPGGLAALTGHPASAWNDRSVPASEVLPPALASALADPDLGEVGSAWAEVAEQGLAALADDRPDPRYDLVLAVVADMLADHALLTVADAAERHAVTVRTLQRLFTHYVGSVRSGCWRATGCTTPSPTSTPAGPARSPTSRCATAGTTRPTSRATSPRWSGCHPGSTATG